VRDGRVEIEVSDGASRFSGLAATA
jgi:hypothetical protein